MNLFPLPKKLLPPPGDPYVTAIGEVIRPDRRPEQVEVEDAVVRPAEFRPARRCNLGDLPGPPTMMNGLAAVFMYTVMGVGDREIADVLGLNSADRVRQVRESEAYSECFNAIADAFVSSNSELLASRVQAFAHDALTKVKTLSDNGKKEETQLRASQDLLNRAGVGPKELFARNGMANTDLRIVIVKGEQNVSVNVNGEGLGGL